jgi:alkanesulfonate monooxygenase SsuD/methylene tetrahydromethanopterin reductase-like flavin-dependent oxidoreductase (luciferase family)
MSHHLLARTEKIHFGSAIRNILCNGGPIAHAEAVRTFLALHGHDEAETRKLHLGFASGRFPFSNLPYGIHPRSAVEQAAWPALRGAIFRQATEIFLRLIRGEVISEDDITPIELTREDFRSDEDWAAVLKAHSKPSEKVPIPPFWRFPKIGVIPWDVNLDLLELTIGCHDARGQAWANKFHPCGVFNLSITPSKQIEATHERMKADFHPEGGDWSRERMPRTVLVYMDDTPAKAQEAAENALSTYWKAMEGTLDPKKVESAVSNNLVGTPEQVIEQMRERFDPGDRLMLWFDFCDHDNEAVQARMRTFAEKVAPELS